MVSICESKLKINSSWPTFIPNLQYATSPKDQKIYLNLNSKSLTAANLRHYFVLVLCSCNRFLL